MKNNKVFLLFASLLLASCSLESSATSSAIATAAVTSIEKIPALDSSSLNYLSDQAISVQTALAAPPANGSATDESELQLILSLQQSRSSADCARATEEANPSLETFFGPSYGPLSETEVQALNPFFTKILSDARSVSGPVKNFWSRPRPYVENSAIHPCTPLENTFSYPSGHALDAWLFAEILSLIQPGNRSAFEARAAQIAQDRVMAGMHHPSDIAAGKELGEEIFQAMQGNSNFQHDISTLQ